MRDSGARAEAGLWLQHWPRPFVLLLKRELVACLALGEANRIVSSSDILQRDSFLQKEWALLGRGKVCWADRGQ